MIAHVVPYRRTPRGTDYFDYAIPESLTVERGDTVWIPLRKQTIPGLVLRVVDVDDKKLKQIIAHTDQQYWRSDGRVELLEWFAKHYGVSLPTAWKTMQVPLLNRPRSVELPRTAHGTETTVEKLSSSAILLTNTGGGDIAAYARFCAKGRTLIVVPEHARAAYVASRLKHPHIIAFEEDPSPSAYAALVETLGGAVDCVVIGTKKMLFVDGEWDRVIIDQEHSKSHKQYDSNPRYDVRAVAAQLTCPVLFSSPAPSVFTASRNLDVIDKRAEWDTEHVRLIDMNAEYDTGNVTWFSDTLVEQVRNARRAFLFLNRTGEYKLAVCMDCDELLQPGASRCSNCRGHSVAQRGKGVQSLERELKERFPNRSVLRVDRSVEVTQKELSSADVIIGTERAFRLLDLPSLDMIGVLSVDHLLLYPHFQSNERVWQLLSELVIAGPPVTIQTHSPKHIVLTSVQRNDIEGFWKSELSARKMLSLPPFAPYIRLVDPRTGTARVERSEIDFSQLDSSILVDRSG